MLLGQQHARPVLVCDLIKQAIMCSARRAVTHVSHFCTYVMLRDAPQPLTTTQIYDFESAHSHDLLHFIFHVR